jgi:hypothetical protein
MSGAGVVRLGWMAIDCGEGAGGAVDGLRMMMVCLVLVLRTSWASGGWGRSCVDGQ